MCAHQSLRGVRGGIRERRARADRYLLALLGATGIDQPRRDEKIEHTVARRAGSFWMTIRPTRFRRLRQRDQKRHLGIVQPLRIALEVSAAGCTDAFEIAAIGRHRQVRRQHLSFGEPALDLNRADDLNQFRADRARPWLQQPRQLHGDRRAALRDHAGARVRNTRARQRDGIDAGMQPEALVFDGDEPPLKLGIDFVEPRFEAPRALARRERHQPLAAMIEHHWRYITHAL